MNEDKLTKAERLRIESAFDEVPFVRLLGIELLEIARGTAILRIPTRDDLKRTGGAIHGGVTASLIDTAAAFAIMTHFGPEQTMTTVDLTVHYLRPILSGQATAHARIVRGGRRIVIAAVDVFDDTDTIVATSLTTYVRVL
jgi:uncharacterized protein (TIGR00369 family)